MRARVTKKVFRTAAPRRDEATDTAIALLVAMLGAKVLPSVPCEFGGCRHAGTLYRNGAWCERHAVTMERPGGA
jgi:hypothetical protein